MRIAVDAYYNNNLGDDLFLDTLINRYGNGQFDFILKEKDKCKAFKDHDRVNFVGRKYVFQNIFKYDAYVFMVVQCSKSLRTGKNSGGFSILR